MNIFTKDDYRKIQAWLKANSIKDSDLTLVNDTIPEEDTLVLVQKINGILSNVKISIKNLLNSTLSKIIIDTIIANAVKVNNILTVTASNVKIDNEKGTTLQDVLDYFEGNKLNRHTDDTFDGNLTVKKNITIEGNIKSHDDTITVEADLEATGEITDGQGNMLSDVNDASKGWKIEYQDPQQDEPTVRAKYVLKDYRGVPKGNVIKVYKDSAITNVYLGTVEDTCNPNTGEVTKHPIHDNNEALSIVYRLDTGKYSLVNVPIKMFATEAEFDKYRGLGVTSNGQVFIKLASDVESSNYLHFNELGEVTADGIETRILRDLGNIITSIAGDRTMWGVYKEHEGTQETSTPNDGSRWGEFKRAEEIREQIADSTHQVFADNWDAQDDDPELPQDKDVVDEASYAYNWKTTDTPASDGKTEGNLKDLYQKTLNQEEKLLELESEIIYDVSAHNNGIAFSSLSALLSAENLSTLIPLEIRYGGMSIRFIQGSEQSSDNKYVQYRLMAMTFSTDATDWQGVDELPTPYSKNVVESRGVWNNCPMTTDSPFGFSIEDDTGMAILYIGNDYFKITNHLMISLQTPHENQILKYIGGVWIPVDNISSINDLIDMANINANDVLKWDGVQWVGISTPTIEDSDDEFAIEDDTGVTILKINNNSVSFGKNTIDFNLLSTNNVLVFNGNKLVAGHPDWVEKNIATYGDSVTAINNGNYEKPYKLSQNLCWGNILAKYFGFSKQFGRGIGSQSFTWSFKNGGNVSWVRPDGTYINRLNAYNYEEWQSLDTKVYPEGVTDDMISQGEAITIRSAGCSWLRITSMFPVEIKDTIDLIIIMYHNDVTESNALDGQLQWIENDNTDPEWAASDEYATYGGDYNIMTTRGGIASTVMKIQAWMPNCIIVLATPISGRGTTGELNFKLIDTSMQKLADIVREMSKLMSIPCIDVYATCGINGLNRTRFISDGIHPYTTEGQKMVARAFIGGLKSIINKL